MMRPYYEMLTSFYSFVPVFLTAVLIALLLWFIHWLLISRNEHLGNERKFARQLIVLGVAFLGSLTIILILPVDESYRNTLVGLFGIILSGILAFSSSSIIANLAAGILLRITKPFKTGDFIRIGDHFGRVSERGLFDTEIQSENREFVSLPNVFCISQPVTTIRSSGTIISATLSLGYEIDHSQIEAHLLEAARRTGLQDPFVHIMELGNFSITYRISGFLADPKFLISERSKLYGYVLDTLHAHAIEIMSPTYMNQKRLDAEYRAMPTSVPLTRASNMAGRVEEIAFDKAERVESLEQRRKVVQQEIEALESSSKQVEDPSDKQQIVQMIERKQILLKTIETSLESIKSDS